MGLLIAGALGMQRNYPHTSKRTEIGFQNIYNKHGELRGLSDVLLVNINKSHNGYLVFFLNRRGLLLVLFITND